MSQISKILGGLLVIIALGAAGLIGGVEFMSHRSEREVVAVIDRLPAGTPFSEAVKLLGPPQRTLADEKEAKAWVESLGARSVPEIPGSSVLHAFVHRGPPLRYILIYTDRESGNVVHADWCHM